MGETTLAGPKLTEADLDFLVSAAASEVKDKSRVRWLITQDEDFRNAFVGDEKTFQRLMSEEEAFLKISPRLYFEILLRKTRQVLETASHTVERTGTQLIAVFDTQQVVDLLSRREVLLYLADMLASFTKVESYSISYQVRKGIWRKTRFNDLDIDSLVHFAEAVDEPHRLGFFKRIADICLFMLGMFPEYVQSSYRYPLSGELRPRGPGKPRRSTDDYVEEGKRFYELAAEHPLAKYANLSDTFRLLHEKFQSAQKPLTFLAEHYLHYKKQDVFGVPAG